MDIPDGSYILISTPYDIRPLNAILLIMSFGAAMGQRVPDVIGYLVNPGFRETTSRLSITLWVGQIIASGLFVSLLGLHKVLISTT